MYGRHNLSVWRTLTSGKQIDRIQCLPSNLGCRVDCSNGPLTRYGKLRVAHAAGMPGTFPRHRLQRKPLVSYPGMHHGTCVTHLPWCMSGSLTRGGRENVPGIPGACATRNFTYLARGPYSDLLSTSPANRDTTANLTQNDNNRVSISGLLPPPPPCCRILRHIVF